MILIYSQNHLIKNLNDHIKLHHNKQLIHLLMMNNFNLKFSFNFNQFYKIQIFNVFLFLIHLLIINKIM